MAKRSSTTKRGASERTRGNRGIAGITSAYDDGRTAIERACEALEHACGAIDSGEPELVDLATKLTWEVAWLINMSGAVLDVGGAEDARKKLRRAFSDVCGIDPAKRQRRAIMWRIDCLAQGMPTRDPETGALEIRLALAGAFRAGITDDDLAPIVAVWAQTKMGAKSDSGVGKWILLKRLLDSNLGDKTTAKNLEREWREAKAAGRIGL